MSAISQANSLNLARTLSSPLRPESGSCSLAFQLSNIGCLIEQSRGGTEVFA
jgi:hypothetical protein